MPEKQEKKGITIKRPAYKPEIRDNKVKLPLKNRETAKTILFDRTNVDDDSVDYLLNHLGEESVRAMQEIATNSL